MANTIDNILLYWLRGLIGNQNAGLRRLYKDSALG